MLLIKNTMNSLPTDIASDTVWQRFLQLSQTHDLWLTLDKDHSQYKIYYVQECTRAKSGVSGTYVT